jgi:hypothetical protein
VIGDGPADVKGQRPRSNGVATVLLAIFAVAWVVWALAANLDAAEGRFVLHMDELITFEGISEIRNASDSAKLTDAIVGGDQRYGRPTWYVPAVVAAPFGEFLGESGQIVVTRMVFAVALLGSLLILSLALFESWTWRAMAIAAAAVTPYAAYFATMPKPEPLMLLFLASFVYLMVRRGQNLGWSWALLGLAFGCKISLAPVLPLLLMLAVFREWGFRRIQQRGPINFAFSVAGTIVAFIVGFLAAVPVVLKPGGWQTYLENTWFNTSHAGSDSTMIGPKDWLNLISDKGFFGPGLLSIWAIIAMLAVFGVGLWLSLMKAPKSATFVERLQTATRDRRIVGAAVFAIGWAMLLAIVIGVTRLWGFYLFPGAVLMVFGAFAMLEPIATQRTANLLLRNAAVTVGAALFLMAFVGGAANTVLDFRREARRSENPDYRLQRERFELMTGMAEQLQGRLSRPITTVFRARFWFPASTPEIRYDPLYGVRNIWAEGYELVFLENEEDPANMGDPNLPYANEVKAFLAQRDEHLALGPGQPCKTEPCYVEVPVDVPGMYVWELANVIQPSPQQDAPAPPAATTPTDSAGATPSR